MRSADLALDLLRQGQQATLRIQGDSMWPTLLSGDEVVVEPKATYQVDDLVAFDDGRSSLVVHRIVAVSADKVRTRGDHLFQADPWRRTDQVSGFVVRVKRGLWSRLLSSSLGSAWIRPLSLWFRIRRMVLRSWSPVSILLFALYRSILRPFRLNVRVLFFREGATQPLAAPAGISMRSGLLHSLAPNLEGGGLILPLAGQDTTTGVVAYEGEHEVAAVWTTEVMPGLKVMHDWYVLFGFRNRGLAKNLVNQVIWSSDEGTVFVGRIQHHNTASRAMIAHLDIREVGYQVEMRLWPSQKIRTWNRAKPGCAREFDLWQSAYRAIARR